MTDFRIVLVGRHEEEPQTRAKIAKGINTLIRDMAMSGYHVTDEEINFDCTAPSVKVVEASKPKQAPKKRKSTKKKE